MALQFDTTTRNGWLNALTTALGGSSTFVCYTGSVPATCATAPSGTLLATVNFNSTPFPAASSGSMTANGLTLTSTAGGTGTAGYFRLLDGSSVCHMQGTCGTSGTDFVMNSTSVTTGQAFDISGFTLTAPGA
jgi:hypothetical protein